MARTRKSRVVGERALQLKIQLLDVEPEIWRRVIVPSALTLRELHAVIQGAMGWEDCHLHMFEIEGRRFEIPEDDRFGPEDGYEDERRWALKDVLSKGTEFLYVYDFGDDWRHGITVEDAVAPDEERCLPLCVAGARACPPEDCGGVFRYPEFLEALADPAHPEHRDMVEWIHEFDPEKFSVAQAGSGIREACASYRRRGWGFGDEAARP